MPDMPEANTPQPNALTGFAPPKWDLVGPTVDDDIRRAVQRYGAEEVKRAIKEATKKKRGRKREPDWSELRHIIEADARDWLEGKDPFAERSNYAIAKEFSERNKGQSAISTYKRIERKLSRGAHNRVWFTLVSAENQSRDKYSYLQHIRALVALVDLPGEADGIFSIWLQTAMKTLLDYEAREGSAPPESMTFAEVEAAVKSASQNALAAFAKPRGLFGSLPSSGHVEGLLSSILRSAESIKSE